MSSDLFSLFDQDDATAPTATVPAPAREVPAEQPSTDDDPLAASVAPQPALPEPPIPEGFESHIPEREPVFDDADADEFAAIEEDIEADTPPAVNPFVAPAAPTVEPAATADDLPPWERDRLEREERERAERARAEREREEALSPAALALPDDDDDDDHHHSGGGGRFALAAPAGLLEKPKEIFQKHPRPVIFGAIGLAVALVMVIAFGGGSPMPAPPPDAAPVEELPQLPADPTLGEPVTLLPKTVSANCGAGQTSPALAFSARPEEAWICPRAHGIDGAIMNIVFERTVQVLSVTVSPGYNYVAPNGKDHWNEHRVVTRIRWRLGGQEVIHTINPSRSGSTFTFNPPKGIPTTTMSLTVFQTERPDAAGVEVNPETGEGGLLPPLSVGGGPDNDEVDKSVAINSIIITGYEG